MWVPFHVCSESGPLDFHDACVRTTWSSIVPAAFVFALCVSSIPVPGPARRVFGVVRQLFQRYLTVQEAEALDNLADAGDGSVADDGVRAAKERVPLWRTVVFSWLGLLQTLVWLAIGSYHFVKAPNDIWGGFAPILIALTWLYTTVRPVVHPTATPPYDLFSVYLIHLLGAILQVGGIIFENHVLGAPLPSNYVISAYVVNLIATLALVIVVLNMPVGIPSASVKMEDIGYSVSPEDYTSLFGWITFSWIYPLVQRGRYTTLNEKDVWELSPSFQSRPLFIKFSQIRRATLFRRLWAANSSDIILDFVLTLCSVFFNYAAPFFLKRILDAIASEDTENRSVAYIYAFLAFACSLMKSQADVQHLWLGRRASTRMRSELMASIYDKALKRKDFSGIIDADKIAEAADKKAAATAGPPTAEDKVKAKAKAEKADDAKAGADVGKIVNLMAGDANRVSQIVSGAYFIYGAPFEIMIAATFLYQLLGVSAFAGFAVIFAGWPLNNYITRRGVRIQKGVLTAKDKRMGVLNELISAVKFIKFFAWEERWIERALEARAVEMKWMVKARMNSVMFALLWSLSPILVSIISFFTFVVQGNELTVSVAFTSIALFSMIRQPLNIIPAWIVQILQAGIALNRISVYLDEDEVTEQVSLLKKDQSAPPAPALGDDGLGLENASLKWNELEKVDETPAGKKKADVSSSTATLVAPAGDASPDTDAAFLANDSSEHRFELHDISVRFPEGQLTVITGPTASGKTAMLLALLGELTLLRGRIIMSKDPSRVDEHGHSHTISYAAQTPWLRHQSIRDNILFGYPYDEARYNAVVEACALRPDLAMLEDGDSTEIGARGVSLSGGQKARVALARAIYARTKYVLLDDPLSAVDSHTSRFLFEKLFQGPLLANRTVVLVTHHIGLVLPGTYYLVRMLDGRIDTQGTVKDLRAQGVLDDITHDEAVAVKEEEVAKAEVAEVPAADAVDAPVKSGEVKKKPRKLIKDEHREVGGVKWRIYQTYLKASSYYIWSFLALCVMMAQLLSVGEKVWIKIWGEAYGDEGNSTTTYAFTSFATPEHEIVMEGSLAYHLHATQLHHPVAVKGTFDIDWPNAREHPLYFIGIYALIGLGTVVVSNASVIAQYTAALRASRILFKRLLVTVVRATMRWHDITPQGRLLNRFGKDIETIDSSLATSLQNVNSSLATFFAAILTVAFVFPLFLIPATIIGFGYRELAIGYLNTGRDLRRMESNSRSPIFSDFGELLEGIVTVRAFSAERRFLDNLHTRINATTKMWYTFWMTNRWLLLNFEVLSATAVLVTTLFALSGLVSAGLAGLCITSAMAFTNSIYWACRFWTSLELDLNSVERIVEYLDLPQEPPAVIPESRPPAYWPSSTSGNALLAVEDLVIKYAPDLPPVLHGVSFALRARERVGLLGRTGSGKSTLAMSILRFVDPARGRILIDGVDIATIGIHDLRSRLTFIPQDATLFSGTLRDNLDPFNEHSDSECRDALVRVHLISASASASQRTSRAPSPSLPGGDGDGDGAESVASAAPTDADARAPLTLATPVSAGGANFSQGQRQLVALARALLRRSAVIVLDEATSSIDFATDARIQAAVRAEFRDALLLTVAHRLRTVIDYDRLLVLDQGRIVEFDTPLALLGRPDGVFRQMCVKSGALGELEAAARAKAAGDADGDGVGGGAR